MKISVLEKVPEEPEISLHWNDLVSRMERPEIFFTHQWALAASRAFSETLPPLTFLAYEAGRLVGVAAMAIESLGVVCTRRFAAPTITPAQEALPPARALILLTICVNPEAAYASRKLEGGIITEPDVALRFLTLDRAGLMQLAAAGMSIGAHSVSHPVLALTPDDKMTLHGRKLRGAGMFLRKNWGSPCGPLVILSAITPLSRNEI